jgi:uncharacterized membrane protein
MDRISKTLIAAGLGAAAAYYWDPVLGNRRRALMRDQWNHALRKARRAIDVTQRDVSHRLAGTVAEMRSCLAASAEESDDVLVSRVRSKLGHYVSHPRAIEVDIHDGHVELRGPILADEADAALAAVSAVRGIEQVDDQLERHESPENVPALQGGVPRTGEPSEWMQTSWSPAARLAAAGVGAMLMLNCLTRRSALSPLFGTAGFALALRGLTNLEFARLLGLGGRRGIDVQRSIVIDQPLHDVFAFLADPRNLPRITDRVTEVQSLGDDRYRKTIAGPGGAQVTLEEKMFSAEEERFVACRSEPESSIQYAARAWFEPLGESRTRVQIHATCNPPGGALAHAAARFTGYDLGTQLNDVLMRAKSYLETGTPPHDAAQHEFQPQQTT